MEKDERSGSAAHLISVNGRMNCESMTEKNILENPVQMQQNSYHFLVFFDHNAQLIYASQDADTHLIRNIQSNSLPRNLSPEDPLLAFYSHIREVLQHRKNRRGFILLPHHDSVDAHEYSLQYSHCPITDSGQVVAYFRNVLFIADGQYFAEPNSMQIEKILVSSPVPMCLCSLGNGRIVLANRSYYHHFSDSSDSSPQFVCVWKVFLQFSDIVPWKKYWSSIPYVHSVSKDTFQSGMFSVLPVRFNQSDHYLFQFHIQSSQGIPAFFSLEDHLGTIQEKLNLIAGGLGHEVNNALTVVSGYLEFLHQHHVFREFPESYQILQSELHRSQDLAKDLQRYSERSDCHACFCLNELIQNLEPLLRNQKRAAHIDFLLRVEDTPPIYANQRDIHQIVLNLVKNAYESMDNDGTITVEVYPTLHEACLAVHDEGSGIPDHLIQSIAEPYMTTKECGTGLGLFICYEKAQANKGRIEFQTGPAGTSFFVFFPYHSGS